MNKEIKQMIESIIENTTDSTTLKSVIKFLMDGIDNNFSEMKLINEQER